MLVLTLLLLPAPLYVHATLHRLVADIRGRIITHALLLAIGAGTGWAALQYAGVAPPEPAGMDRNLVLISGFAAAHLPAAAITLIKRLRQRQGIPSQD